MQTSNKAPRSASPLPTGDLLSAGAVNNAAFNLRKDFKAIGIDFPGPFIAWQHSISGDDLTRLQKLLSADGTKRDVDLLEKAKATYRTMSKGVIRKAAA